MTLLDSVDQNSLSTIKLTIRNNRHATTSIASKLLKPFRPLVAKLDEKLPEGSPRLNHPSSIEQSVISQEQNIENIWQYELTPKDSTKEISRWHRIYYFAGGGFRDTPSVAHWKLCAKLACRVPGVKVYMVSYPLAPKSTAETAIPQLQRYVEAIHQQAEERGDNLTLAGDSSGGNIALVLGLHLTSTLDAEHTCRLRNIFVMSPAVDMRNTNPDMKKVSGSDVLLTLVAVEDVARVWVGSWSRSNPQVSPLLADVSNFQRHQIKVHGIIGTYDVLAPDAALFLKMLDETGVSGEWLMWEKQMHCFPLAFVAGLKEAKAGLDWIIDVLGQNCT